MNKEFTLNNKIIETKSLILKPFEISDLHDFYNIGRDKELEEYFGNPTFRNKNETMMLINEFISSDNVFAIEEKSTHKCIGCIGFIDYKYIPELECVSKYYGKRVEYYLEHASWNKGYTNEVFEATFNYLFNEINLDFIIGYFYSVNKALKNIFLDFNFKKVVKEDRPTRLVDEDNNRIIEEATVSILFNPNKDIKVNNLN